MDNASEAGHGPRGPWPGGLGCPDARSARVPRRVSDPRAHDVPDQPLAGADAATSGGAAGRVRADVARAGHPRLGGGLVGDAGHRRRPGRTHHRRAARLDRDASERRDRRGGRPLVLPPARPEPQPDRLRTRQLPVGSLPLPGSGRPRRRRLRERRGDRRGHRRTDARSSRSATSSSAPARSRTWRRSSGARTTSART